MQCSHLNTIRVTDTNKHVCEDCESRGYVGSSAGLSVTPGYVGCCDSSKNRHATKHFHRTEGTAIRSIEPGEDWVWCYIDEGIVDNIAA